MKGKYIETLKQSTPARLNEEQMKILKGTSIVNKIKSDIESLKETITTRFEAIKDDDNF